MNFDKTKKYYTQEEGVVIYNDKGQQVYVKRYEIFEIIDQKEFDKNEQVIEDCGDYLCPFELSDEGVLGECETIYRDGWNGAFYDVEIDCYFEEVEFNNGCTSSVYEGEDVEQFNKAKEVDFQQLGEIVGWD